MSLHLRIRDIRTFLSRQNERVRIARLNQESISKTSKPQSNQTKTKKKHGGVFWSHGMRYHQVKICWFIANLKIRMVFPVPAKVQKLKRALANISQPLNPHLDSGYLNL